MLENISTHILKRGFSVSRDEVSKLNYNFIFKYYIHEIVLVSKTEMNKKILFCFADEEHNKKWRIEEISFFDPIIDGTPQSRIPG